jgi:hypothetical protein
MYFVYLNILYLNVLQYDRGTRWRSWLGHAVAQLVEALRNKPEGRGFDSRWWHWNFSFP